MVFIPIPFGTGGTGGPMGGWTVHLPSPLGQEKESPSLILTASRPRVQRTHSRLPTALLAKVSATRYSHQIHTFSSSYLRNRWHNPDDSNGYGKLSKTPTKPDKTHLSSSFLDTLTTHQNTKNSTSTRQKNTAMSPLDPPCPQTGG